MPILRPVLTLLLVALAIIATATTLVAQPDEVSFSGSSNIRTFTCRSRSVGKTVAVSDGGDASAVLSGTATLESAALEIPARSFHCGIAQMNRHLRHTLEAQDHPLIRFWLESYELVPGDSVVASIRGTLEIAGTQQPVELTGTLRHDSPGELRLSGSHRLRPSDFGVRPPRRFLGLLRVRDDVLIRFDLAVRSGEPLGVTETASRSKQAGDDQRSSP